jgi:hypothetical protein
MKILLIILIATVVYLVFNLMLMSKIKKDSTRLYIQLSIAISCLVYLFVDYFVNKDTNIYLLLAFTLFIISSFVYYFIRKSKSKNEFNN